MFCENCGIKVNKADKFCENCGVKVTLIDSIPVHVNFDNSVWTRTIKVVYISLYLPLLAIVPTVWIVNEPYCYYKTNCDSGSGEQFWYTVLSVIIYMAIIRLIKLTYLYISFGKKPRWDKEFKKLY